MCEKEKNGAAGRNGKTINDGNGKNINDGNGKTINDGNGKTSTDRRTEKRKTGDAGEGKACLFLCKKGFRIVARNFSFKGGELDIVAADDRKKLLVYVEVKSRNSLAFGLPCQAVGMSKQSKIRNTAMFFFCTHPKYKDYSQRMDIIEVLELPSGSYIRHLENAF